MILENLAEIMSWVSFGGLLIILVVFGIPVVLIVLCVKQLVRSNEERRRLRLEVGKLADELEQVRKQKESGGDEPKAES